MKVNRIELRTEDILEKKFKKQLFGFKQEEVDDFLDKVIRDYQAFQNEIDMLKQELERFKKSTDPQPQVEPQRPKKPVAPYQVNYDVLKRLSNLEKAVFGQKVADGDS